MLSGSTSDVCCMVLLSFICLDSKYKEKMTEKNLSVNSIPKNIKTVVEEGERVQKSSPHEVSYSCSACNKKFKRKTACSSHMRICNVNITSDSDFEFDYNPSDSDSNDFIVELNIKPSKRTKINGRPQMEVSGTHVDAPNKIESEVREQLKHEPKKEYEKEVINKQTDENPNTEVQEIHVDVNGRVSVAENTATNREPVISMDNIMNEFVSHEDTSGTVDNNMEEPDDYIIEELRNVQSVQVENDLEHSNGTVIEEDCFEHVIERAEVEEHTLRFSLPEEKAVVQQHDQIKSNGEQRVKLNKTPDVSIYEFVDEEDGFRQEQRKMDLERKKRTCKNCYLVFEDPMEVLRHNRTAHTYPKVWLPTEKVMKHMNVKDKSKCPICGKPLYAKYKSEFVKHLKTHIEDYEYQCKVCKHMFRRKDHLRNHESRHIVGI
ncbi:histone-lysine N-methyltransferase PRDM9-like isoform X1 [Cylas formicarius]|uniref:histone-lysine N-methyltransferase PRDM9-like isoform X1 n=1 Tax=Cylas formicarius TaxID=197179 RepID=UPI0029583366|nr:histone-lysine N-methyltransferase PRDM9-like isoform X1 [Cylas formicarius]